MLHATCICVPFALVAVSQAQLSISNGVFLTKPDPYVEFSVDGQQKKRTDVERKTLQPSWNADFSVLVIVSLYFQFLTVSLLQHEEHSTHKKPRADMLAVVIGLKLDANFACVS